MTTIIQLNYFQKQLGKVSNCLVHVNIITDQYSKNNQPVRCSLQQLLQLMNCTVL
jgi:hypothetical protein